MKRVPHATNAPIIGTCMYTVNIFKLYFKRFINTFHRKRLPFYIISECKILYITVIFFFL